MTPFGDRIRSLRARKGVSLKEMAAELEISSAYLSALEHGRKGLPSPMLLRQICTYFGLIWDEAEEMERLAAISDPRVVVDTGGLSPDHTLAANLMARHINLLTPHELASLLAILRRHEKKG
ncbi:MULTISPECIES: helix-turn-helix domain-containing protein [unclassified Azospirillum]|uniref:helix-turn-helix domain-containing protein n=1 Tax=unclassified Azospirillum TaxID=2630922 RepID=UPI000B697918|nr:MULTISPECIES: helix-turn-helix transcriptional regulator [unclassified Azospirillum]SNT13442.1 Helix-turn-helix domain-containing protein [Azospirillum sp. RU38E]SNT26926.1 Helix-turn-helix domain-containing protein [Azospirillum sp. RU37A]